MIIHITLKYTINHASFQDAMAVAEWDASLIQKRNRIASINAVVENKLQKRELTENGWIIIPPKGDKDV